MPLPRAIAEDRASVLASRVDTLPGQLELTETRLRGFEQKISKRETTQPSELATEARPVERVLSESNPSEANPAQADVRAPDNPASEVHHKRCCRINQQGYRRVRTCPGFGGGQCCAPVFAIRRGPRRRRSLRTTAKSRSTHQRHHRRRNRQYSQAGQGAAAVDAA